MAAEPGKEQALRTDELAHQIEYITGGKWTPEQYRRVVSLLRMYRHQAVLAMAQQFMQGEPEKGSGSGPKAE